MFLIYITKSRQSLLFINFTFSRQMKLSHKSYYNFQLWYYEGGEDYKVNLGDCAIYRTAKSRAEA